MKAIIDGVRYDTEKAEYLGGNEHGCYPGSGDFSHWSAELYRTPKSHRYFLAGEGGGLTQFACHCADGGSCGGSKIIPIDADEAMRWAEQYLDVEIIEEYFSEMIED